MQIRDKFSEHLRAVHKEIAEKRKNPRGICIPLESLDFEIIKASRLKSEGDTGFGNIIEINNTLTEEIESNSLDKIESRRGIPASQICTTMSVAYGK